MSTLLIDIIPESPKSTTKPLCLDTECNHVPGRRMDIRVREGKIFLDGRPIEPYRSHSQWERKFVPGAQVLKEISESTQVFPLNDTALMYTFCLVNANPKELNEFVGDTNILLFPGTTWSQTDGTTYISGLMKDSDERWTMFTQKVGEYTERTAFAVLPKQQKPGSNSFYSTPTSNGWGF